MKVPNRVTFIKILTFIVKMRIPAMKKYRTHSFFFLLILLSVSSLMAIHNFHIESYSNSFDSYADFDSAKEAIDVQVKFINFIVENISQLLRFHL